MNRRHFLHLLGIGAASVAAPKIIFDMGANLYKYDREKAIADTAQLIADRYAEYLIPSGVVNLTYNDIFETYSYASFDYISPSNGVVGGIWRPTPLTS